jgi:hypothetical protein
MCKKSGSGSGINNPDQIPRAYKNLCILTPKIVIRGSGMEKIRIRDGKIRIRDKHPGSATLESISKGFKFWLAN